MSRASHYAPKTVLRNIDGQLLQEYFKRKGVLTDFDYADMTEDKVEALYSAWLTLSIEQQYNHEVDFQDIYSLAHEQGNEALRNVAEERGESLPELYDTHQLEGFYDRAMWLFLHRHDNLWQPSQTPCVDYWDNAARFLQIDSIPNSYWQRRKDLPTTPADTSTTAINELQNALGAFIHDKQGRGQNCKVDHYPRQMDGTAYSYFIANLEDFAEVSNVWTKNTLERHTTRPSFQIAFMHCASAGSLDISFRGYSPLIPALQLIFAKAILHTDLSPAAKVKQAYQLKHIEEPAHLFEIAPNSDIESVQVRHLRYIIENTKQRITIEADSKNDPQEIYTLLARLKTQIPAESLRLTQVKCVAHFVPNAAGKKHNKTFTVGLPHHCALGYTGQDGQLRQMLIDSGIQI
jgi:hypothetical protein